MAYASMSSPQFQAHSDEPYDRGLRVSWTGIISGTLLGWAAFSLLMLVGAAVGLAKVDPNSAQPASGLGVGSGVFGGLVLLASSFFGAYMAVRIGGNRRRPDALLHGAVCWALSMLMGALLALGAARTAAQSAAAVAAGPRAQAKVERESRIRENRGGPTAADRERASEVADTAAKTTGGAAGGAALAMIASLAGAFAAARRGSGGNLRKGLRRGDLRDEMMHSPSLREDTVVIPPAS